jgi:hypothetical protein
MVRFCNVQRPSGTLLVSTLVIANNTTTQQANIQQHSCVGSSWLPTHYPILRCRVVTSYTIVRTHMHMHMCIRTHMHMHMCMHMSLVSLIERRGAGAGAVPCNPTVVFPTAALLPWVGKAGRRVRVQAGAAGGEDQNDRPGEVWRDVKVESGPSSAAHHGSAEARGTAPEQRTQR